jgi:L-2-hydroxyglutarate oxidase LhgO
MKLAIVFEVPDDQADAYADVTGRLIQRHTFADQQQVKHWSFDVDMRPVAAALVPDGILTDMVKASNFVAELLTH